MESYRIETTMPSNGQLTLKDLPFQAGELVEVIVLALPGTKSSPDRYPLRGSVIKFDNPFEPAVTQDWEAMQ